MHSAPTIGTVAFPGLLTTSIDTAWVFDTICACWPVPTYATPTLTRLFTPAVDLTTPIPANWFLAKLSCVSWFASALHGLIAVTILRTAPGQGSTHVAILTTPTRIAYAFTRH